MKSKIKTSLYAIVPLVIAGGVGYGISQTVGGSSNSSTASISTTYTVPASNSCHSTDNGALPDSGCTPGRDNHSVVQSTIKKTICVKGWTSTIRPPVTYTEPLKFKLMSAYGDTESASHYELDHLIPLELGGSPTSPKNLWPEPHDAMINGKQEGSYVKDGFENSLRAKVCSGTMTLAVARKEMRSGTWIGG